MSELTDLQAADSAVDASVAAAASAMTAAADRIKTLAAQVAAGPGPNQVETIAQDLTAQASSLSAAASALAAVVTPAPAN